MKTGHLMRFDIKRKLNQARHIETDFSYSFFIRHQGRGVFVKEQKRNTLYNELNRGMDTTSTKPVVIMYEPLDEEKEDLGRSVFAQINETQQNTESTIEVQGKPDYYEQL